MRPVSDTFRHTHGNKPVISIVDIGDSIVGKRDTTGEIVMWRYGPHAVSLIREYLKREYPDHTIRG